MSSFLWQPGNGPRIGDYLISRLQEQHWTSMRAAVAFVKRSGIAHLATDLEDFAGRAAVEVFVGVDLRGTSVEGLADLSRALGRGGRLWVVHDEGPSTFHPKLYAFGAPDAAEVVIGSGNLTEGGLFTNFEAAVGLKLDLASDVDDRGVFREINGALDALIRADDRTCQQLTRELLRDLLNEGYVVPEGVSRGDSPAGGTSVRRRRPVFGTRRIRRPPRARPSATVRHVPRARAAAGGEPIPQGPRGFVMTLQQTDVGRGQRTAGTSARSPEVFIPLVARDAAPDFWGYPTLFTPDPSRPGKMDRTSRMRIGTQTIGVSMMTWPVKHDFRLRHEALRSAGSVGDILKMEVAPPRAGYDYVVEVVTVGTALHATFAALCTNPTRNSLKEWGYY